MKKIDFANLAEAFAFANSHEGQDFIKKDEAGFARIPGSVNSGNYKLYETPRGAALAVLSSDSVKEFGYCDIDRTCIGDYGLVVVCRRGQFIGYAATNGQDEAYLHTDAGGFLAWCNDDNWHETEWHTDVEPLETVDET